MAAYEIICRLCMKICENFKAIEGNVKDALDKLLPIIDLTVIQESVVCTNCVDMLIKCFDFKTMCLHTHDYIVSFVNQDDVKLDLKDVYLSKTEYSAGVSEDESICGLCIDSVKKSSTISLHVKRGDVLVEKMIKQCLPELDLRIIKKPVICTRCHGSLEDFFRFRMNCLIVEDNVKKYCETLDINSKDQMKLSSLLYFTIRDVTTSDVDDKPIGMIKVEKQLCGERLISKETGIPNRMFWDDSENPKEEVEYKITSFMDKYDGEFNNVEQFLSKNMLVCKGESNNIDVIKIEDTVCGGNELKMENPVEMEDQKFLLNEEIEIKTDDADFIRLEGGILPQQEVTSKLHREQKCNSTLEADRSKSYIEQTLPNNNVSTGIMYQCASCSFQTKYNQCLKNHVLKRCQARINVTVYKCDFCLYQTENKINLKRHLILHKSPSEVTMYECDSCLYRTKRKGNLKQHLLMHKDPSEMAMHKCDSCSFQTKRKDAMKMHLLTHADPSKVAMHKCNSCSYLTNNKRYLNRHLLSHRDPSEVTMYKCHFCSFQTKRKGVINDHLLLHKDPSDVTMYKCDSCLYQSVHKRNLKTHLLTHKDPTEVTMYKCDCCSFQSLLKGTLKRHLLTHKNPTEVTMYKCDSCSFQTKRKDAIKIHLLTHVDPSKVTMYKCDSCLYETKFKDCLKKHVLRHKKPSEVTM